MNQNRSSSIFVLFVALLLINPLLLAQSHSVDSPEPNAVIVGGTLFAPTNLSYNYSNINKLLGFLEFFSGPYLINFFHFNDLY
jgi:hypothetical protein